MIKINEYVEALIFSFGDGISLEEIVKRTKSDPIMVKKAVNDLNKAYSERKSAFYILTEGNLYRMRLRSDLLYLVQDNLRTDMSRGVLMTLSLIVLNGKIKQADLVKKRGSISYQHVKELQSRELVSTAVEDGKKVIKITPSFYDYFDVDKKEFKEIKETIQEEIKKEDDKTVEYKGN
ncbi:SMC-Scp complex subunit ScpB [Candidatus Parvarchaeota archaeon]|jgi:segregation and condensation protein B|nr:SMC-Scp complex subunit ScpB [Candidatus Parvarchaeota archaeon]